MLFTALFYCYDVWNNCLYHWFFWQKLDGLGKLLFVSRNPHNTNVRIIKSYLFFTFISYHELLVNIYRRGLIDQCWVQESSRINMTALYSELCEQLQVLYGATHASRDSDSLPSSLHLPPHSPSKEATDMEDRWHKLQQNGNSKDHSCVQILTTPQSHLRFVADIFFSSFWMNISYFR